MARTSLICGLLESSRPFAVDATRLQGILCGTRWAYEWAHPRLMGSSDFGREDHRHKGWRFAPPEEPPPDNAAGLSSLTGLPGSRRGARQSVSPVSPVSRPECVVRGVRAVGGPGGAASDDGSSTLFGVVMGSMATILALYMGGLIGGNGHGGGGGGRRGRGGRGRMNRME